LPKATKDLLQKATQAVSIRKRVSGKEDRSHKGQTSLHKEKNWGGGPMPGRLHGKVRKSVGSFQGASRCQNVGEETY